MNDSLETTQEAPIEPKEPHFSFLNLDDPSRLADAVK
jgi:hypothetical protein